MSDKLPNAADGPPVDPGQAATCFACLGHYPKLALAVSGGADSMALAVLMDEWARGRAATHPAPGTHHMHGAKGQKPGGGPGDAEHLAARRPELVVLSVDHGIRAGARAEMAHVAGFCRQYGLAHRILCGTVAPICGPQAHAHRAEPDTAHDLFSGDDEKTGHNLQARARRLRFRLLHEAARRERADALVLAHHRDDQVETIFMRLLSGSGVYGLGAMRKKSHYQGLPLYRPLLDLDKAQLRATLRARALSWKEDPGNHDRRFARTRLRAALREFARQGFDTGHICRGAANIARAADAIDMMVTRRIARAAIIHSGGPVCLDRAALGPGEDEIALRLLSRLLCHVGGRDYAPRSAALRRLAAAISGPRFARATLAGVVIERCKMRPGEAPHLLLYRESGRNLPASFTLAPGERIIWDGRFAIARAAAARAGLTIRAADGEAGLYCRQEGAAGRGTSWPRRCFIASPLLCIAGHRPAPFLPRPLPWLDGQVTIKALRHWLDLHADASFTP